MASNQFESDINLDPNRTINAVRRLFEIAYEMGPCPVAQEIEDIASVIGLKIDANATKDRLNTVTQSRR